MTHAVAALLRLECPHCADLFGTGQKAQHISLREVAFLVAEACTHRMTARTWAEFEQQCLQRQLVARQVNGCTNGHGVVCARADMRTAAPPAPGLGRDGDDVSLPEAEVGHDT
eukprot:SAG11_NODE_8826_length_972_cov_2.085911_2_plen_113_part_00